MLEYNTARNQLVIREYGRNIQKMIEDAVKIEDRKRRNEVARAIVKTMSQANPAGATTGNNTADNKPKKQESADYWHKLWDHLFIISGYQLDVDAPFPKPTPVAEREKVTQHEEYKCGGIHIRSYGRYLEKIIKEVSGYPDSPQKERLIRDIANLMKKLYLTWNRDTVDDALISQQLMEMSDGQIVLPQDFVFTPTQELMAKGSLVNNSTKKKKKKKKKKKASTEPTV